MVQCKRPTAARLGRIIASGLLLAGLLAACSNELRQVNRSLLETFNPDALRNRNTASANAGPIIECFNQDLGLLYTTSARNCAPGYQRIDAATADQIRSPAAPAVADTPAPGQVARGIAAPPFCYDDKLQMLHERSQCEPWERPVTLAEAEQLQRTQVSRNLWCFYANQRILYRAQGCRPGDRSLAVAEADKVWESLAANKRPKDRPLLAAGVARPATGTDSLPAPPMQAAPRRGVQSQPLQN